MDDGWTYVGYGNISKDGDSAITGVFVIVWGTVVLDGVIRACSIATTCPIAHQTRLHIHVVGRSVRILSSISVVVGVWLDLGLLSVIHFVIIPSWHPDTLSIQPRSPVMPLFVACGGIVPYFGGQIWPIFGQAEEEFFYDHYIVVRWKMYIISSI